MRTSRRFQVRVPPELEVRLDGFARANGLTLAASVRLLVWQGLQERDGGQRPATESPAALAALTAAEHAVLMVASILPEGERRMLSLAERASQAAEERLLLFQEQAAAPKEVSG